MELCNLTDGSFSPLQGFMGHRDYDSVVETMRLSSGAPWSLPITLDIPELDASRASTLSLSLDGKQPVAEIDVEEIFRVDAAKDSEKIYGTTDFRHPGVAKELSRSPLRAAGRVKILHREETLYPETALSPTKTKRLFRDRRWKTIAGFQTRNPLHRAHEYLQRIAMEVCDGLFIHPLLGWKKAGDFSPRAVIDSYREQIKNFYPADRIVFATLRTPMRYAGPREAVFHALVRKNYGCTHFIVGRDHAGVGNYYKTYAAQALCESFSDLGITILALKGPFYCKKCGSIVTEKTCAHGDAFLQSVSGTQMRALLSSGKRPPQIVMRREISKILLGLAENRELLIEEQP